MMEYTKEELEEKFGVKIKFYDPDEAPLSLYYASGYYDWTEGIIYLSKYLSGKPRLSNIAHEIGHKRHFDELVQKEGLIIMPEPTEMECEAWKRGLPVAKELNVVEKYRENWRAQVPPISQVICECPFPGDDKVPYDVSIGKGQEYSFKEWASLMKEYMKTGKWRGRPLGRKHLGITEHVTQEQP